MEMSDVIIAVENLLKGVSGRKYIVLTPEQAEAFNNGENPDVLRSENDMIPMPEGEGGEYGRINAWIVSEASYNQNPQPFKTGVGSAPIAFSRNVFTIRLEYYYQFDPRRPGGLNAVRALDGQVRNLFNNSPRLGISSPMSDEIDQRHTGLQLQVATEGEFGVSVCFMRMYTLSVPVNEPL